MTDEIIDRLHADVFATLGSVPTLSTVTLLKDDEGDIETEVQRRLQTLIDPNGKIGLAIIVFAPEVVSAEKNLPGPVMDLQIEIQIIEQVLMNRNPANGSGISAAKATLRVMSALHLRNLGEMLLYLEKDPAKKMKVKKGYVSYLVTLNIFDNGLDPAAKPLGVEAVMTTVAASVTVAGELADGNEEARVFPEMPYVDEQGGAAHYELGDQSGFSTLYFDTNENRMRLFQSIALGDVGWRAADNNPETPLAEIEWIPEGDATGTPVVTLHPGSAALALTCASPGSTIRYTTDGTFPTEAAGTLYSAPITGLATGVVVRAAAYVADQAPGDVLELTVTE